MSVIDFRKHADELFSSVFWKVRKTIYAAIRFVIIYGGSNSSKSVSEHQSEIINLLTCKYDILIMRKVAADIYDSCYKLLEEQAERFNIYDRFEWTYSQGKRQIMNKKTGRRILFRGADDVGKLKSMRGIGRIVLEEADQFTYEDFKEINRRARGFEGVQIIFILNPVDEDHWIKKLFIDEPGEKFDYNGKQLPTGIYKDRTIWLHFTYHDNRFCTEDDIRELELAKLIDEYDYDVYTLGKWGHIRTGQEFYPHFKESMHVRKCSFDPKQPLHVTFDFNAVPYMTMLCSQYVETEEEIIIRFFAEYCLESPLNSVNHVCQALIDDYEKYLGDIFYYGDASGNNRIAGKGDAVNYDDVRETLYKWIDDDSNRVSPSNKPIMKRRKIVNKCLSGHLYYGRKKIRIEIDPSCEHLIRDFKKLKLGPKGKFQEIVYIPQTDISFVKYGHTTDALEYEFCWLFEELM